MALQVRISATSKRDINSTERDEIRASLGIVSAPVNTAAPTISGTAQVGQTLTSSDGAWTGSPTVFARRWLRGGTAISGATGQTYQPVTADIGFTLTVEVIASNAGGPSQPATSLATSTVTAAPVNLPVNTALPVISGTPQVGQTLTATDGSWTNSPTSYARQWLRGGTAISGATGQTYLLTADDFGATITFSVRASNAGGQSAQAAVSSGVGPVAAVPGAIGGVSVGDLGTGVLDGFKMAAGDDFEGTAPASRWSGRNITGKYSTGQTHWGHRLTNKDNSREMYIDPDFQGGYSQSPTPLGYDGVQIANGVATLTASPVPSALLPFLPTTYTTGNGDANAKPRLISGSLKTVPTFQLSAQSDWAVEFRMKIDPGVARGYWPSGWPTSIVNWPDFGEVDIVEVRKDSSGNATTLMNVIISNVDGGPNLVETVAQPAMPSDRYVRAMAVKHRVSGVPRVSFYDDFDTPGTLTLRAYTATRVPRIRGPWPINLDMAVSTQWDSSTFNIADWPKKVQFDWWRAWVPATAGDNEATVILPEVLTTPGGSWNVTIPSRAALYGSKTGTEHVIAAFPNYDSPGMVDRVSSLRRSGSQAIDLTARTVSGTVPTSEGGFSGLWFFWSYDDGTPAKRVLLPYFVAPAVKGTLFADANAVEGSAVSLSVAYADFHSGDLSHTYTVNAPGLTVAYGVDNRSATITGNMPTAGSTRVITVTATNMKGQATTVTRTLTATAAGGGSFSPDTWADLLGYVDFNDASTVFANAAGTTSATPGSSIIQRVNVKKISGGMFQQGHTEVPDYVTDANGMRCADFSVGSLAKRLVSLDAAFVNRIAGDDTPYVLIGAFKRGTPGQSRTVIGANRNDSGSINDQIRHYIGTTNVIGTQRLVNGGAGVTAASTLTAAADQWDVITWIFQGTQLIVRKNGVADAPVASDANGAIGVTEITMGAMYSNSLNAYDTANAFKGRIGEFGIANYTTPTDTNLLAYEAYLMNKWVNTSGANNVQVNGENVTVNGAQVEV